MTDHLAEYLALRAANDRLRESGSAWLRESIERICNTINTSRPEDQQSIQLGRQEWQFTVEEATMVGERIGLRHGYRTLLIEIGWPRLPEHGFVPDNGLARGQIGMSQNTMLDPQTLTGIILKRNPQTSSSTPLWHLIANKKLGENLTEPILKKYIDLIFTP